MLSNYSFIVTMHKEDIQYTIDIYNKSIGKITSQNAFLLVSQQAMAEQILAILAKMQFSRRSKFQRNLHPKLFAVSQPFQFVKIVSLSLKLHLTLITIGQSCGIFPI